MLDALTVKLQRAGATLPLPGGARVARPLKVMVVDASGDLALSCSEAAGRGELLRLFPSPEEALLSATEEKPDVVFVAADRPGIDGLEVCHDFVKAGLGPVVLMASDAGFAARVKAQSKGARGYVHRLPDAASLLKVAADFAGPPRGVPVLALAGDRTLLGTVAETLSADGLAVTPCLDPRELFDALDAAEAAIVVISAELKGINGLSLLRALRADSRHGQLPVLVLAKGDSRRERLEAFDAGADDVLPAPLNSQELLARIRVQVRRRAQALEYRGATLPGFPTSRSFARSSSARFCSRAGAAPWPCSSSRERSRRCKTPAAGSRPTPPSLPWAPGCARRFASATSSPTWASRASRCCCTTSRRKTPNGCSSRTSRCSTTAARSVRAACSP